MKSGYINLENGGSSYHKQAAEKSMFKELTPRVKTAAYCPPEGDAGMGMRSTRPRSRKFEQNAAN